MSNTRNAEFTTVQRDGWLHPANQQRSIVLRDELIEAGLRHLCNAELDSLNIRELASACNVSVGAFYKRFTNKQGFLQTLQWVVVQEANAKAATVFSPDRMQRATVESSVTDFVGFMIELFSGPGRGVIRASYKGFSKDIDTWESMRESSRKIRGLLVAGLGPKLNHSSIECAQEKVKFVYQIVNGTLINELLNPWHVFTIDNSALKSQLVQLVLCYLRQADEKPVP